MVGRTVIFLDFADEIDLTLIGLIPFDFCELLNAIFEDLLILSMILAE